MGVWAFVLGIIQDVLSHAIMKCAEGISIIAWFWLFARREG